jgi:hypothetical protein
MEKNRELDKLTVKRVEGLPYEKGAAGKPVKAGREEAAEAPEMPSAETPLMSQARDALKKGDIAAARELFARIEQEYLGFPQKISQERKELEQTLGALHDAYIQNLGMADKDAQKNAQLLRDELAAAQTAISSKDLSIAADAVARATDLFNRIPEDALELRTSLAPLLGQAQQSLIDAEAERVSVSDKDVLRRLDELLVNFEHALSSNSLEQAFTIYTQIEAAKTALPSSLGEKLLDVEDKLAPAYEKLISLRVELLRRELAHKEKLVLDLAKHCEDALLRRDTITASRLYSMARAVYASIPSEFFSRKAALQKQLIAVSRRLSEQELSSGRNTVHEAISSMMTYVDEAQRLADKGDEQAAAGRYTTILQDFALLPKGFAEEKQALVARLSALYATLLKHDGTVQSPLTAMMAGTKNLLDNYHSAINSSDCERALEEYNKLKALSAPGNMRAEIGHLAEQAPLLREAVAIRNVTDLLALRGAVQQLHSLYVNYKALYSEDTAFLKAIRNAYFDGLHKLAGKEMPVRQEKPAVKPAATETAPGWERALADWRNAMKNNDWDSAVEAAQALESLGNPPPKAVNARNQASLLLDVIALPNVMGESRNSALELFRQRYDMLRKEAPDDAAFMKHLKELYVAATAAPR